jgi:hypothetical protein
MSRVTDVIANVRATLADSNGDRYTDSRLLSLYNQGLKDIVVQTDFLTDKVFIEIEANINTYNLGTDVLKLRRIQYLDKMLPIVSHDHMDKLNPEWELITGSDVQYAVANLLQSGSFKIYPRIVDASMDYIEANSSYGILIDMEFFDGIYNLPDLQEVTSIPKYLVVYYTKVPTMVTLSTTDDDLQLGIAWDNALIHYIAGMALRDDADQQNRAFGNEELQLYSNYVGSLIKRESHSNVANITNVVQYRGAFE